VAEHLLGRYERTLRYGTRALSLSSACSLILNARPGRSGPSAGTPFPGGGGIEVDTALCPFCPARWTPEIG